MTATRHYSIRMVTAASLFDGHDASINIIRRTLQDAGVEVIHLGHNRSVREVVEAALQEGAQGICVSSYQGGHMEYFKYLKDLLRAVGADYVKIYGGGGGVIVHQEKRELENYGIDQIFHPDDGRRLGLEGMIQEIVKGCDFDLIEKAKTMPWPAVSGQLQDLLDMRTMGLCAVSLYQGLDPMALWGGHLSPRAEQGGLKPMVLGVTGTGGAGKSSLVDELLQRFLNLFPGRRVGVFCVDPTRKRTGGALLGDRIRMNSLSRQGTYMFSIASRASGNEMSASLAGILEFAKTQNFALLIAETSGIGQANTAIVEVADLSLYVMTSEFGSQSQLEKIDMLDFADFIAINKADHRGSSDALRDVRKQYRRNRKIFQEPADAALPVFLTQASHFNDQGVNQLFFAICSALESCGRGGRESSAVASPVPTGARGGMAQLPNGPVGWSINEGQKAQLRDSQPATIIAPERQNYLAEIVHTLREYKSQTQEQAEQLSLIGAFHKLSEQIPHLADQYDENYQQWRGSLPESAWNLLAQWDVLHKQYQEKELTFQVRGHKVAQPLTLRSLSGLEIRRIALPQFTDWGDRYRWLRLENYPGHFPYTAGVFPLKRQNEDPTRQFAGEGTPERTNRRFHYLSKGHPAVRLSTAFDSVTLYGHDPDERPDIFGKVGESGVSVCSFEDMKKLYADFALCDPLTSVSMTINGPAPMILAFYLNAAIDQQILLETSRLGRSLNDQELTRVRATTLQQVRGTVQADILKEDQGQNTCIFSIDFALKMMGDIQEYFIQNQVRNFYSVSISGYHIAEAGANPISQLAFTLANGFTYVEYYLQRGMQIDDFAPNLSFFFSNGLDPEYSVMGRVARRMWAVAMRDLYGANERSQKLKYHIQTSGRSLHAQEIDFNDIRTTLQALLAIYDNCNSLHTNAYDEAITTPTEESVRRAMAIQLIINKEFGMAKNENPNQGAFLINELTELVEEAVLGEFLRINERGGVLGAMETQYQRSQIQEESLDYELRKHSGDLPIIGVNTYVDPKTLTAGYEPPKIELARATKEEKHQQLDHLRDFQARHLTQAEQGLERLKEVALQGGNIFTVLMDVARVCSLHQMTQALNEVGGQYRRNL